MDEITKIFHEQLKKLPDVFLEQIIIRKLKQQGVDDCKKIAPQIVTHIHTGGGKTFVWDDGQSDKHQRITLEFTADDAEEIEFKVRDFLDNKLGDVFEKVIDEASAGFVKSLRNRWPEQFEWEEAQVALFRYNLEARWGNGLNLLRMLLTISREWGEEEYKRVTRQKKTDNPALREVFFRLHVRACQVADEIICLLENGFSDGAMARWRTLHEIGVVAQIICEHGEDLAVRYMAHDIVEAKAALDEYERSMVPLGAKPSSKHEKESLNREYNRALTKYGRFFKSNYGWAADHLNNPKPTFSDLERAVKNTQIRSYYKMASYNVHASPKGIFFRLGTFRDLIISGRSNAGLVDPAQRTAYTLSLITSLFGAPQGDAAVMLRLRALLQIRDMLVEEFDRADKKLIREERRKKKTPYR